MVRKTNSNKNRKPKLTPRGVFVSGRERRKRKPKYGNKLDANKVDATSAEFKVSPLTDHALAMSDVNIVVENSGNGRKEPVPALCTIDSIDIRGDNRIAAAK